MANKNLKSLQPLQSTQYSYIVNPVYGWGTIIFVWMASMLPWRGWEGSPDFLILILAFWCAHEVKGVGLLAAFGFGFLMDVHDMNILGEHALTYVLVIYGTLVIRKRMMRFGVISQLIHMFPIFFLAPIPSRLMQAWFAGVWPGWVWVWSGVITGVLWLVADLILKLPLRPVEDDDATI